MHKYITKYFGITYPICYVLYSTKLCTSKCHYPNSAKETTKVACQIQNSLLIFLGHKIDHNKTILVLHDHSGDTNMF